MVSTSKLRGFSGIPNAHGGALNWLISSWMSLVRERIEILGASGKYE